MNYLNKFNQLKVKPLFNSDNFYGNYMSNVQKDDSYAKLTNNSFLDLELTQLRSEVQFDCNNWPGKPDYGPVEYRESPGMYYNG